MFNTLLSKWLVVALLALAPISEVRIAILTGIGFELSPFAVFWIAVLFNSLVFVPIYFVLQFFYTKWLSRINFIKKSVETTRTKTEKYVEKYGFLGMVLFVGLPLPLSGVWSATILAWVLGMDWRKTWTSIILGVMLSGLFVLAGTMGLIKLLW